MSTLQPLAIVSLCALALQGCSRQQTRVERGPAPSTSESLQGAGAQKGPSATPTLSVPAPLASTSTHTTSTATRAVAPLLAAVPNGKAKQLSVGNGHACAIMQDDTIACWSNPDAIFELGEVPRGPFRSVRVGMASTCAERLDGTVVCFGGPRVTPTAPAGTVRALCHDDIPCVERSDGTAACFDKGKELSLGRIQAGSLACGSAWSCGLDAAGHIGCVMIDKVMALGSEAMVGAGWRVPKESFAHVFSGYQHGCALKVDGSAVCWGRDTAGETEAPKGAFKTLALGEKITCGLRPDGSVQCWGGTPGGPWKGPFAAVGVTTHMDGRNSVCALRADETISCWPYDRSK